MFPMRISMRGVFLLLAVVAGACSAVVSPSEPIASLLLLGSLLLMPVMLLGVIFSSGEQRAFCAGALTVGLFYALIVWWNGPMLVTTHLIAAAYREYHGVELSSVTRSEIEEALARQQRQYLAYIDKKVNATLADQLKSRYQAQVEALSKYRNEDFAKVMGHCSFGVLFGYLGAHTAVSFYRRRRQT